MAKIDQLMENEEFITKLEECETEEATKALYAEYGLDMEPVVESEEISEDELENVTGGAAVISSLVIAAAPFAWKSGCKFGVLVRANYDAKKYGNMYRTYSKKQVDSAIKYFEKFVN